MNELLNEVKDFFVINFEDKGDTIELKEDGHRTEGSKIRHTVKRYFASKYPELYDKVEKHTGDTFYKATYRTPPFIVLMLCTGHITPEQYVKGILDAGPKEEVVANYIPNEKFKDTLFDSYRVLAKAKEEVTLSASDEKTVKLPKLSGEKKITLDTVLKSLGVPDYDTILDAVLNSTGKTEEIIGQLTKVKEALSKQSKEWKQKEEDMSRQIMELGKLTVMTKTNPVSVKKSADGRMPEGKVVTKTAREIFGIDTDMEVPFWEWDGDHPDVPEVDENYIFREELLVRALYAIITNQRMYLQGHTGTGKTTLIEQIAARLNWPFMRISFDSEITRMDLIGRDTLKDGASVFIDGMLPRAMSGPYITCFDELDFCRPDVAYVMQAALEGNSLIITEDGGRVVQPHEMFRMFGTGNTVGQGDEHGMYQGARPQSLAFLDRFTIWGKVDYLDEQQRLSLIQRHYPALSDKETSIINKYVTEHLEAFKDAKILQPISPRGMLAVANATNFMNIMFPSDRNNSVLKAINQVVVDRATESDGAVIRAVIQRVLG